MRYPSSPSQNPESQNPESSDSWDEIGPTALQLHRDAAKAPEKGKTGLFSHPPTLPEIRERLGNIPPAPADHNNDNDDDDSEI